MKVKNKLSLAAIVASLSLVACGKTPSGPVIVPDDFEMITNLDTPFEIHTELQKEYLNYDGEYDTMPANAYPDGNDFLSDSLPVKLEWEYDNKTDFEVTKYSVSFGQEEDLSDGYEVMGTSSNEIELINPFLGTNYFRINAYLENGDVIESNIREFNVDGTSPRNLKIEGLTNCRDLGGRELQDGGTFRQGLIYRTSGNRYQNKQGSQNVPGRGIITEDGIKEMREHLQIKTEININDSTSYNLNLEGTQVKNFYMDYGGSAAHHFSRNTESLKNFFKTLANIDNYPIFFHCRIGTDRTGLCGIMTNGLLGVSLHDIYQDYLFSNFGNIESKRYIGSQAGQDDIKKYIEFVNSVEGETFQNKCYNTLLALGLERETLDSVIEILTDGEIGDSNKANQIVKQANEFTVENTRVNNDTSERDNPDYYVTLQGENQSLSFDFDVEKSFTGQLVAYMGNSSYVNNKYIDGAIEVYVDGDAVTLPHMNYQEACMGVCGSRMNYFPVILGELELDAGSHTLEMGWKGDKMNVSTISIFGQY